LEVVEGAMVEEPRVWNRTVGLNFRDMSFCSANVVRHLGTWLRYSKRAMSGDFWTWVYISVIAVTT
jgi:hypothetical protein